MRNTGSYKRWVCVMLVCLGPLAVAEVKPLAEYREASRMWLGVEEGSIRPASYQQFRPELDGYVVIHAKDQQMLKKGEHWATIDPEQLALEQRSVALEDARAVSKERAARQDAKDQYVRRVQELHESRAQQVNMRDALKEGQLGDAFVKRVKQAMQELEQQIEILKEQTSDKALEDDLKLIREEFQLQADLRVKKIKAFERRSILVAERDGKLQLGENLKRDLAEAVKADAPVWVRSTEIIGSISNENEFEILVSAIGPLLSGMPTDQMMVFFQDPQNGQMIKGEYLRTDERDNGRQIHRDFVFRVDKVSVEAARRASGVSNTVHVYRKFDKPCRIVFKKDLVFTDPEQLEAAGWVGLVAKIWPGSKVLHVGSQTIAVEPAQ